MKKALKVMTPIIAAALAMSAASMQEPAFLPNEMAMEPRTALKTRRGYIPTPKTDEERLRHKEHKKKIKARRNARRRKARR